MIINELSVNVADEFGIMQGDSDIKNLRYSINIDEEFDNLLDGIDISDEDFNAWMWEMNNLPTEEKPKRVISRRHLTT